MSAFNLNKDKNRGLMSSIISTLYHIGLQNTHTHVFMYTDVGIKIISNIWKLLLILYFCSDNKMNLMLYYIFKQNIYCPDDMCLRKTNSQTGTTRKVDQLINCAPAVKLALRVLQMQNLNTKLFC